jgi:hypothetical protein
MKEALYDSEVWTYFKENVAKSKKSNAQQPEVKSLIQEEIDEILESIRKCATGEKCLEESNANPGFLINLILLK